MLNQNSQSVLRVILSFELQFVTIVNFKPHKLFDSSIPNYDGITFYSSGFNYDGTTFCSLSPSCNGSTFCFPIVYFDQLKFCFWASKSPPFFNFLPLAITTFNIKKNHRFIINFSILMNYTKRTKEEEKEKKKKCDGYLLPSPFAQHHHHRRRWLHCSCHLLHNKTIKKGYDNCRRLFL